MKIKFSILLLLLCVMSINVVAQNNKKKMNTRITSKVYLENLVNDESSSEYVITYEHVSSISGIKHTYIRQAIDGIEVSGTESSIHTNASGTIISAHVNFVDAIKNTVKNKTASITAEQAIASISKQMDYKMTNLLQIESAKGLNQKVLYNKAGISTRDIPVQQMYYFKEGVGTSLIWEISIKETDAPNWWNFRVDATDGKIIDQDNWIVDCASGCDHNEHEIISEEIEVCNEKNSGEQCLLYTVEEESAAMVGSYRVFAFPLESPYHGARTLEANPDDATASPFGWHDTDGISGAEFTYTKGNNVDAYDDGNGTDSGTVGDHAGGGAGLVFDFPFDKDTGTPNFYPLYNAANQSQDAAIANVFYWSNIIHDAMYQYGFNEAAGNFQENNYGKGGTGGDSVDAEAQDEADLTPTSLNRCNANFGTPTDGGNPQMQMYICDQAGDSDSNDGDYDSLVIVHEYGHGISNRLTGGPGVANGLQNAEQMGEGWSDFYGYMLTMTPSNFNSNRTTGTFLFEQGVGGGGIRNAPYSTSLVTNPWTYSGVANTIDISQPHGIGFIWASMLYEMTQALITQYGFDADIYNGTGGNNIALQLVTEGLKLQPTSPGFVDGRDAILAADLAMNGGANECLIWTAFAKRGLGFSADQGASSSRTDGTEAYDLPVATLALSRTTICDSEGTIIGLNGGRLIGGVYSGTGVTDDGNGMTFTFDTVAAGIGNHTITYTDSCRIVPTQDTDVITVTAPTIPVIVCQDTNVTLDGAGNATITNTDVVTNLPLGDYIEETITFAPISNTGTTVSLGDDNGTAALSIGFNFSFYGTNYNNFYIASNGWISFTGNSMTGTASRNATTLPTAAEPNAMVAGVWDDLDASAGGTIRYQTSGSAPNRKLLVDFDAVPHWNDGATTVTFQIQLHEGTDRIELHYTDAQNNGGVRTAGIENAPGNDGLAITGGNLTVWTASNEAYAIYREVGSLADNCGFPVTVSLDKSSFTCRDIGTNTVTITADDGNGGIATCSSTVTVIGETTTYTGSWNNGVPDAGKKALFNSNYNTAIADIDACSCEVANNATVTVAAGDYMNIDGNITVGAGSSLIVEHTGSIVQVDDAAVVTNSGTINVNLTTPALNARDFLIIGCPMTAEDDAMFSAYQVLNHTTANFTPYVGVPPVVGVNFHDQESNDWSNYTGTLAPAEGYLVRPSYTAGGTYNYVYDAGTLNNGIIAYTAFFGDDKEDSPNVMANPYPSAIDSDLLIFNNAIVDEVYFWEHNTTPASGVPGPLGENFNMEDISTRNYLMGIAAATGGGVPSNIISTGQGFGIKANAAGDVTFNNALRLTTGNGTIRQTLDKDLLWIEVRENTYGMGSSTGIGFTEGATPELDAGYDTMKLGTVVSLYSHLEDGSQQLGVQGREAFDTSITIPMGFSTLIEADAGIPYVINISDVEGANIEQAMVYLIDHLTNTITNLSTDRYEFLSDAGTFDNRFTLQFETEVLGSNDSILESVSIYPNPVENILNIVSPKAIVTAVAVYDVRGRVVNNSTFTSERINHQVDLSALETALYFVKITAEDRTITKRIVRQ